MRKSYATEIFILFSSGIAGVCFYNGGWINYLVGSLLILGTSYFLVSKLKEQTIKEYIAKSKNYSHGLCPNCFEAYHKNKRLRQ